MKNTILFLISSFLFIAFSCNTSKNATEGNTARNKKEEKVRGTSLSNELRKYPSVQVRGDDTNGSVTIGGYSNTAIQNSNPLFVIDGQQVGNSLTQAAAMIAVPNIKSIRILKGSEAFNRYGRPGSNGAIEIRMKKEPKKKKE